jgi:hypothetical protein
MARVERTLVKSPPELWELVDDAELMQRWAADLVGDPNAEIEVTERSEGERLAWRAAGDGGAGLELWLAEKGWGTNVVIEARRGERSQSGEFGDDDLERLLDELSSPQRRPFTRG